jgi:hypothetical protein
MSVAYLEFMSLPQLSLIVLDHRPKAIHDCVVDEAKGRKVSSITRIPGGHSTLNEKMILFADCLKDFAGGTWSWNLSEATLFPEIRGCL